MNKNRVCYSRKIMMQLLEQGFEPIKIMVNPLDPKYNCWLQEDTEEFEQVFSKLLAAASRKKKGGDRNGRE